MGELPQQIAFSILLLILQITWHILDDFVYI